MENSPHRQLPVSPEMAITDAMHGKYNNTNTMKENATKGVKSGFPETALSEDNFSDNDSIFSSDSEYNTPNVLTINSFAAVPESRATLIFQLNPNARTIGSQIWPIWLIYDSA